LIIVSLCTIGLLQGQPPDADKIDFQRAKQLRQKMLRGDKLTDEEQAYLEKAMRAFREGRKPGGVPGVKSDARGLKPLTDMTADDRYKGEDGGLYGGGKNEPPEKHLQSA